MKRFLTAILVTLMVLTSCTSSFKQIELKDVKASNLSVQSVDQIRLDAKLLVNNPTKYDITVKDVVGTICKEGKPFADFVISEEASIASNTEAEVPVCLLFKLSEGKTFLNLGLNLLALKVDDFTVDADVKVKAGPFKKTFEYRDVKVGELVDRTKKK